VEQSALNPLEFLGFIFPDRRSFSLVVEERLALAHPPRLGFGCFLKGPIILKCKASHINEALRLRPSFSSPTILTGQGRPRVDHVLRDGRRRTPDRVI